MSRTEPESCGVWVYVLATILAALPRVSEKQLAFQSNRLPEFFGDHAGFGVNCRSVK